MSGQSLKARTQLEGFFRSQDIHIPSTFFEEPTKRDAIAVLEGLICLVLGYNVGIRSGEELKAFLAEREFNAPPGSLPLDCPIVQELNMNHYLPDNGDKHLAGVSILVVYRYLQQLGHICGIEDVTLGDLLRPTGERMFRFALAAADYIRFRAAYMEGFREELHQINEDWETINQLKKTTTQYKKHTIATIERKKETERLAAELKLTTKLEQQKENLRHLCEAFNQSKHNAEQAHTQSEQKAKYLDQRKEKVRALEEEKLDLQSQVVESPQRIMKNLKELQSQIKTIDTTLCQNTKNIPLLQLRRDILQKLFEYYKESMMSLERLDITMNETRKVTCDVSVVQTSLDALRQQMTAASEEEKTLRARMNFSTGERDTVRMEIDTLTTNLEQIRQRNQDAQAIADSKRRQRDDEILSVHRQIEKIKQEIGELNKKKSHIKKKMSTFWPSLQAAVETTQQELLDQLGQSQGESLSTSLRQLCDCLKQFPESNDILKDQDEFGETQGGDVVHLPEVHNHNVSNMKSLLFSRSIFNKDKQSSSQLDSKPNHSSRTNQETMCGKRDDELNDDASLNLLNSNSCVINGTILNTQEKPAPSTNKDKHSFINVQNTVSSVGMDTSKFRKNSTMLLPDRELSSHINSQILQDEKALSSEETQSSSITNTAIHRNLNIAAVHVDKILHKGGENTKIAIATTPKKTSFERGPSVL